MRRALIFLLALLALPVLPGVAGAHVEVTPSEAPAGKKVNLALEVGHGCDGSPTNRLEVLMPESVAEYAAGKVPGWKVSRRGGNLMWTGGSLPDHDLGEFPFTATMYGKKGDEQSFKILQRCENGSRAAWIQEPNGDIELAFPASILTLTSTAKPPVEEAPATGATGPTGDDAVEDLASASASDVEKGEEEDDGGGFILPLIGVVLIAASVTAFVVIQRGKKNRS